MNIYLDQKEEKCDFIKLPMSIKPWSLSTKKESSWYLLVQKVFVRDDPSIFEDQQIFFTEIVDGNLKMTLGMIWTIILRFAIQDISVEGL